jgi:hypothetical protein
MKTIMCILILFFLITGCSSDRNVLTKTNVIENVKQVPNPDFKSVRKQRIPKAIASIFATQREGGQIAVIQQLKTCYETEAKRNLGHTHELEDCIAQDFIYTQFTNSGGSKLADVIKSLNPEYVTIDAMEKRIYKITKSVGMRDSDIEEIIEIGANSLSTIKY